MWDDNGGARRAGRGRDQAREEFGKVRVVLTIGECDEAPVERLDIFFPHQAIVRMFDSGGFIMAFQPLQKGAEVRVQQSFVATADEEKTLHDTERLHDRLCMVIVSHTVVRPQSQHDRIRLFPMTVQVDDPPFFAPCHPADD